MGPGCTLDIIFKSGILLVHPILHRPFLIDKRGRLIPFHQFIILGFQFFIHDIINLCRTNITIILNYTPLIREFFVKSLIKHCLYFKSLATLLHLLPDSRGNILGEPIHEFSGDGVVHAHDEAVVDLSGFGAAGF